MSSDLDNGMGGDDRRLAALGRISSEVVYRISSDWATILHVSGDGLLPELSGPIDVWIAAHVPKDEQTRVRAAVEDVIHRPCMLELEHRVRRTDGKVGRLRLRAAPILGKDARVDEWLGIITDVTEQHEAQDRQKELLAELQHRVRNTLAVVRSIVRRSADTAPGVEDYVRHLDGRLGAFIHTQVTLTRKIGAGVDLEDIIHDELVSQAADERHFTIGGPATSLRLKTAEVLTLAIHEIATNATKFGALSHEGGRITVTWTHEHRDGQEWLALVWKEHGVPIVDAAPRRDGFGTEVVTQLIAYELQGDGSIEFQPGGVCCRIDIPLAAGETLLKANVAPM